MDIRDVHLCLGYCMLMVKRYSETLKIPEQNTAQVYFLIKRKAAIGYAIVDSR